MKNITLSVPDETYRKARIAAARRDTSVSALVAGLLDELAHGRPKPDRRAAAIDAAFNAVPCFAASGRLSRDQLHDRTRMRWLNRRALMPESASLR